jgi:hypothetical protein
MAAKKVGPITNERRCKRFEGETMVVVLLVIVIINQSSSIDD